MSDSKRKVTLHLLQKSISSSDFINQIDRLTRSNDQLVFIGDSVFDLTRLYKLFEKITTELSIYAIDSDITARALNHNLNTSINIISFEEFVTLTIKADQIISW